MDTIRTDTLLDGPMTHLVPAPAVCLGCFLNPRGAVGEAPMGSYGSWSNQNHVSLSPAWWYKSFVLCRPRLNSHWEPRLHLHWEQEHIFPSSVLTFCSMVLWGKGNRFHRDGTSDTVLQTDLDPYARRGSVREMGGGGCSWQEPSRTTWSPNLHQICCQATSAEERAELGIWKLSQPLVIG